MTERDMTGPLLNRSAWLEAHGFAIDPFSAEAFQAETDPLFEHPGLPAFVDPPNYEEIRGRPDHPGFRYIFAPNGVGKSSLRRRMRVDFDASLAHNLSNAPRVLAVEYLDHSYASDRASAHDHVARIVALLANRLAIWYPRLDFRLPTTGSAHDLLSRAVQVCRSGRLDGVCILVDNIRDQGGDLESAFNRVAALASQPELLNIPGVLFKFMFPNAIFETAARVLPLERLSFPPNRVGRRQPPRSPQPAAARLHGCVASRQHHPAFQGAV
ncbi:MAG: hypothetical protein M5R40_03855 [Anaerolineae bacterium]|nr:hypothetical protein [Anaerolineae bacterium]